MAKPALKAEFDRMPADEQIRLVQDLWDTIAERPASVPVPDWHYEELERRVADHQRDPTDVVTLDELKAKLIRSTE